MNIWLRIAFTMAFLGLLLFVPGGKRDRLAAKWPVGASALFAAAFFLFVIFVPRANQLVGRDELQGGLWAVPLAGWLLVVAGAVMVRRNAVS